MSTVNPGLHLLNWLDINDFSVRWILIAWVAIERLITLVISTPLSQGLINWSERTIAKLLWRTFDCRHLSRLIVAFRNVFPVYRSCVLYPLLLCSSLFDTIIQSEILYHHNIRIDYFVRLISFLFPQFIASIYPTFTVTISAAADSFICSLALTFATMSSLACIPFDTAGKLVVTLYPGTNELYVILRCPYWSWSTQSQLSLMVLGSAIFLSKNEVPDNVEWNPDCAIRLYNLLHPMCRTLVR